MLQDKRGFLWLATSRGIILYSPDDYSWQKIEWDTEIFQLILL
jgi:ligand-binding sensor domain-containing protein